MDLLPACYSDMHGQQVRNKSARQQGWNLERHDGLLPRAGLVAGKLL